MWQFLFIHSLLFRAELRIRLSNAVIQSAAKNLSSPDYKLKNYKLQIASDERLMTHDELEKIPPRQLCDSLCTIFFVFIVVKKEATKCIKVFTKNTKNDRERCHPDKGGIRKQITLKLTENILCRFRNNISILSLTHYQTLFY